MAVCSRPHGQDLEQPCALARVTRCNERVTRFGRSVLASRLLCPLSRLLAEVPVELRHGDHTDFGIRSLSKILDRGGHLERMRHVRKGEHEWLVIRDLPTEC